MWKYALPLLLLSGCATLPMPAIGLAPQAQLQVARSEAQVRALILGLRDPAGDAAIPAVAASIDAARITIAGQAAIGDPSDFNITSLVALGVTLAICRDGLARIEQKLPDRNSAIRYARGEYALVCLAPLSVLSVR